MSLCVLLFFLMNKSYLLAGGIAAASIFTAKLLYKWIDHLQIERSIDCASPTIECWIRDIDEPRNGQNRLRQYSAREFRAAAGPEGSG